MKKKNSKISGRRGDPIERMYSMNWFTRYIMKYFIIPICILVLLYVLSLQWLQL